jgi:hypothetical protein
MESIVSPSCRERTHAQAFCERESIGIASFYQWRSKLGEAINAMKPAQPVSQGTAGFVELGTLNASVSRFELRLDLGGGVLLHLVRG